MPLQDANPTPSFGGFGLRLRPGKIRNKAVLMCEVAKVDNVRSDRDNIVAFEVESGTGIKTIPYSQARA